ncbi:efflux RND transporter periplasmic adaptor subunit [Corynebacterium mayonis]|uniref:efflux RND transporter periplasmic adaptor subunit n=1 Tax=Corynebacterium mayonis TaxID=3062461 RepID=UPI003140A808
MAPTQRTNTNPRNLPTSSARMSIKRAVVVAVTASALFATGCGVAGFGGGKGDNAHGLVAGDYTIAEVADVTNSVVVNGNIVPVKMLSITSPLQSKVTRLAVSVGDRVQADQFLVEMDTEELRRQLNRQNQAAGQAPAAYVAAANVEVLASAPGGFRLPNINDVIGGLWNRQAPQPPSEPAPPAPPESLPVPPEGQPTLPQPQSVDPGQAETADPAEAESRAAQEAARQQAQQLQQVQEAQQATGGSDGTLEYQIQQATVYAPIAGLVTSVDVQEGDIPQGKLLTIADDSRLLIRSEVREADVSSIKPGDRVTFTSTATGDKEFAGRVNRIQPISSTPEQPRLPEGQRKGDGGSVTFPIEIEVEGNKDGLLLGGSVRAEIITEETPQALSIPRDAVVDGKVLVLAGSEDGTSGTIEERKVDTGAANEVDIAVISGELKAGDIVINWPDKYRDRLGEKVDIEDPYFDPEDVKRARDEGSKRTPAGDAK